RELIHTPSPHWGRGQGEGVGNFPCTVRSYVGRRRSPHGPTLVQWLRRSGRRATPRGAGQSPLHVSGEAGRRGGRLPLPCRPPDGPLLTARPGQPALRRLPRRAPPRPRPEAPARAVARNTFLRYVNIAAGRCRTTCSTASSVGFRQRKGHRSLVRL